MPKSNSKIENSIQELENFLENCKKVPLSPNKIMVNREELEYIIEDIKKNIPEEVESIRFTEDCQLKVSFTNLFGDNPDVNSVTFPLKDIASKEITNDLLAKKFPEVFSDDLRMVVEYVNTESAAYLKPVVERYNLDNPKKKIKEITNLAPDDKVKGQTNKLGK